MSLHFFVSCFIPYIYLRSTYNNTQDMLLNGVQYHTTEKKAKV